MASPSFQSFFLNSVLHNRRIKKKKKVEDIGKWLNGNSTLGAKKLEDHTIKWQSSLPDGRLILFSVEFIKYAK